MFNPFLQLFLAFFRTTLNVPRDSKNNILRPVHLTPLKSTLRILVKLKIITVQEFNAVLRNKSESSENSLIRDVVVS